MKRKICNHIILLSVVAILFGCQQAQPPGSKEAAIHDEWGEICTSYYCEGYDGYIQAIEEDHIVVSINGNTRYLYYNVTGVSGSYEVNIVPTANSGKEKP